MEKIHWLIVAVVVIAVLFVVLTPQPEPEFKEVTVFQGEVLEEEEGVKFVEPVEEEVIPETDESGECVSESCFFDRAVKTGNIEFCEKVLTNYQNCVDGVIKKTLDESLCEEVLDDWRCFTIIAAEKNDEKLCENAMPRQNECYYEVAVKNKRPELCEKIEGNIDLAEASGELFIDNKAFDCYIKVRVEKQSDPECEKLIKQREELVKKYNEGTETKYTMSVDRLVCERDASK